MTVADLLTAKEINDRKADLSPEWKVGEKKLEREWKFPDFKSALSFVNQAGALAEALNHHPDVELGYGRVKMTLSTHSRDGLTSYDFDLAERIDELNT